MKQFPFNIDASDQCLLSACCPGWISHNVVCFFFVFCFFHGRGLMMNGVSQSEERCCSVVWLYSTKTKSKHLPTSSIGLLSWKKKEICLHKNEFYLCFDVVTFQLLALRCLRYTHPHTSCKQLSKYFAFNHRIFATWGGGSHSSFDRVNTKITISCSRFKVWLSLGTRMMW